MLINRSTFSTTLSSSSAYQRNPLRFPWTIWQTPIEPRLSEEDLWNLEANDDVSFRVELSWRSETLWGTIVLASPSGESFEIVVSVDPMLSADHGLWRGSTMWLTRHAILGFRKGGGETVHEDVDEVEEPWT